MVSGASGTECFWPRGKKTPYLYPWKSFPIALRSEYLGVLEGTRARDVTDQIMKVMELCVNRAEEATGIFRKEGA